MTTEAVNGRIVLEPSADLCEGPECDQMEREILAHARQGRGIVVDLSRTRLLTARGLGILANACTTAIAHRGHLVVCGANAVQRQMLSATHLADAIPVVEDVPAAVRLLGILRPVAA